MPTVHDAFAPARARTRGAPIPVRRGGDGAAYGIAAGATQLGRGAPAEVERLRAAYAQAGYGHGHRVGLLLENRPAFFSTGSRSTRSGVSVVPINADMRAAELDYLIGHSEIVPGGRAAERARRCCAPPPRRPALRARRRWRPDAVGRARRPPRLPRATRRRADRAAHRVRAALHLGHHRPAQGLPARQRLLPARRRVVCRPRRLCRGAAATRERIITPLPLNHMNAMAFSTMAVMLAGGCLIVQLDRFHPADLVAERARERARPIVHYLGVMPAMLLAAPASASATGSTPCASASAPASTASTTRRSRRASAFRWSRPGR